MAKLNEVIGSFIIRYEGFGCLTSIYFNGDSKGTFPECCKLQGQPNQTDKFQGKWKSVWLEDNAVVEYSNLKIDNMGSNTYKLEWSYKGFAIFEGEAFIYNDVLVGAYWSVD